MVLWYCVLCCGVVWCVVLYCVVLCCVTLCCAVLCWAGGVEWYGMGRNRLEWDGLHMSRGLVGFVLGGMGCEVKWDRLGI